MKKLLFTLLSFGAAISFVCAQQAGSITVSPKTLRTESQPAATLSSQPDATSTNSGTVFRKGVVSDWFMPLLFAQKSAIGPTLQEDLSFCVADSQVKWVADAGVGAPDFMGFGHSLDPKDDAIDNTDNPGIKFDKYTRYRLDSIGFRYLYVRHVDSVDDGQGGMKPVVDTLFIAYYTGAQIFQDNFTSGARDKVSYVNWDPAKKMPANFTKLDTILLTPDRANNRIDTTSTSDNETTYGHKVAFLKTPDGFPEVAANRQVAFTCTFKPGVQTVIGTDTAVMVYQKAINTLPPGTRRTNVFGTRMFRNDKRNGGTPWSNPTFFNSHLIMPNWNGYVQGNAGWASKYLPGSAFVVDFFNETYFKLSSDNTGIGDVKNDVFVLSNIYPNPATSGEKAVLAFNLKRSATVVIKLMNLVGQEVRTVTNERFASGEYEANINLDGIKAGVYFVNMSVDGISECKKITVTE